VEYERRFTINSAMPAVQLFIGLWLLASIYFLQFTIYPDARFNAAMMGWMVIGISLTRLAVSPPWQWVGWVNVLLGIWIVVSPFAMGLGHVTDMMVSFVVAGVLLIVTGVLGQMEKAELKTRV
jgi:hypothetical protein